MTTYSELRKSLSSDNISRLYLLLGPEEYLARRLISFIIGLALGEGLRDFNLAEIDAPSADPPGLLQELNAYPMGAQRRVAVIRHVNSLAAPAERALQEAVKDLPDFLTLILTSDRMDRRKAMFKTIAREGVVVELGPLRPAEVKAWIREMLSERGKKISAQLTANILELTGNDLSNVSNEVTNLLEYMGDRSTVTRSDVDNLIAARRREPIYKLTEHIADRDLVGAWLVLQQLLVEGEQELRILWHLDNMVKRMLRAKCLLTGGVAEDVIVKTLQIKPFLKSRFLQQVHSFSLGDLRRMYHAILEWDNKFKSTSRWHPDIDLEMLVRELCVIQGN